MKLTITHKLVLAFFALTLTILVVTLSLARWSFERGFLDYVNALEQERLAMLGDELAAQYQERGPGWEWLQAQEFTRMLRVSGRRHLPGAEGHPPPGPHPMDRRPLPQRRPLPGRAPQGVPEGPATALFNASGEWVAGADIVAPQALRITVPIWLNGVSIGTLQSLPRRQLNSTQETAFSKQQLQTSVLIGLACMLVAVLLSIIFARGLLAPVRRMITAVAQLSKGDYTTPPVEQRSDELGKLSRDLDQLALSLRQSRAARRRWLADISHELRTPLTILSGEIDALKDGLRSFDATQLVSLDQEVQRLTHLVNDLYELSLSDIGGLRYAMEEVALDQWLLDQVQQLKPRASEHGLELSLSAVPVVVRADPRRLEQLLGNLLENALAYTDSPGRISVDLVVADTEVSLSISDTAPGPSQEQCKQLFEPLFRVEASRSRHSGGAGLGLAICRNIVEAHGGSISARPSSDHGLCVTITLPVA
ncbi:ATP-binding protein [bacterium]|nr:ATP-binding protein [bacterium]